MKYYILDTNILLEDSKVIEILEDNGQNKIIIPYSVICELDRLKSYTGKSFLVSLCVDEIIKNTDKIHIIKRINFNYNKENCRDESIIEDIRYYINNEIDKDKVEQVIFVSNDKILRYRFSIELPEILTEEYKKSRPFETDSEIYNGVVKKDEDLIKNCFVIEDNDKVWWEKTQDYIDEKEAWKIKPKDIYQNMLLHLLLDDDIKVVSVSSPAGLGKTLLTLAAALEITQKVINPPQEPNYIINENGDKIPVVIPKKRGRRRKKETEPKIHSKYKKIYVVRPTTIIGEELGFLPGEISDKLNVYFRPIQDLILKLHEIYPCNRLFIDGDPAKGFNSKVIEFLSITYIRGMNIDDAIVIVDEAQNLSRLQQRYLLSRMCNNTRVFLNGDPNQVDLKYLDKYNNGLNWVVKLFKDHPEYAHIQLKSDKSRGPITDLVLNSGL